MGSLPSLEWSAEQREYLAAVERGTSRLDAEAEVGVEQFLYLAGKPGSGKTEVLLAAAAAAVERGLNVAILVGGLVDSGGVLRGAVRIF